MLKWLKSFFIGKISNVVLTYAVNAAAPNAVAASTFISGYLQDTPISYTITLSVVAFSAMVIGISKLQELIRYYNIEYKLIPTEPFVGMPTDNSNIKLGINLFNSSNQIIEYRVTSIQNIIGTTTNPQKRTHIKKLYPCFPGGTATYKDEAINVTCKTGDTTECRFSISIEYGTPGHPVYKLEKSYIIYVSPRDGAPPIVEWVHDDS